MIDGTHIDKEFLNIVDMFRDKQSVEVDDGLAIRHIENVYSKFNLQSESLLMNRIKVNYRNIINVICKHFNDNDFKVYNTSDSDDVESKLYVVSKFKVLADKYNGKIDFQLVIESSKIESLGNWFFGASVICNAIAKSEKCKADDIIFKFQSITMNESDAKKFFNMGKKNMMAEIPQFTMSERTEGLDLTEFKPDDFEIWNYVHDNGNV